jgi:hypothetical protein
VADQLCGLREQNLIAGAFLKPHLKHLAFRDAPHARQHLIPLAFSNPQAWQRIDGPLGPPTPIDPLATGIQATGAFTSSSRLSPRSQSGSTAESAAPLPPRRR